MSFFRALRSPWIAALMLAGLSGCAWLPQSDTTGALRASGTLYLTAEGGRLETCEGAVYPVRVDASMRALFEQVAAPNQTLAFVDLRGDLLADNTLRPHTVLRMGARGNGCADALARQSQWIAVGERPEWLLRIAERGLQMTTLGDTWQPVVTEQLPEGARGFRSLEGEPVELWLYPQPCFTVLDGHYYSHRAQLLTAGQSYAGCAYPGMLAADQPPR